MQQRPVVVICTDPLACDNDVSLDLDLTQLMETFPVVQDIIDQTQVRLRCPFLTHIHSFLSFVRVCTMSKKRNENKKVQA